MRLLPALSPFDPTNHDLADAVSRRNGLLSTNLRSDCLSLFASYLGAFAKKVVLLSAREIVFGVMLLVSAATFLTHILHVVFLRTKKEVGRSHALWVVAGMQNIDPTWNLAMVENPGNTMCQSTDRWPAVRYSELTISVCIEACRPLPTISTIRIADFHPKPSLTVRAEAHKYSPCR